MGRRALLGAGAANSVVLGSGAVSAATGGTTSPLHIVNVADRGASGDGITDDTAAILAGLAEAQIVDVPAGSFRIRGALKLRDGQLIRGTGRSGWEPYTGSGAPRSATRSEFVIDDGLGFDARDTNNAGITGIAIRARGARQSQWGQAPGYQPGTIGIAIAGSSHFDANAISFHGLETGMASLASSGRSTQMPRLGDWVAEDCRTVVRFVSEDPQFYVVRDARIEGCLGALHCGSIIEARGCDGLRIEDVRFFQCLDHSIHIEGTPFVAITGATLFETGREAVVLRGCDYVTISGTQVARAGFYNAGPPVQRSAVLLEDCNDVAFEGLVEQPTGRAFTIRRCANLSLAGAFGTPFWSTGYLGSDDGAVRIEQSRGIVLSASFSGRFYWVAVWTDAASAGSLAGRIVTEGTAGTVRSATLLPSPWGHVTRVAAERVVAPGETVILDTLRVLLPAGQALFSCCVELTANGLQFAAAEQRWEMLGGEPGNGLISTERKVLARNPGADPSYMTVPLGVYNPASQQARIPPGFEIRLSVVAE